MSATNISRGMEITAGASQGRPRRPVRAALGCALVTATAVTVIGASGVAGAATTPAAQLSFSPATIAAHSHPDMTFMSQNVPSGSLLYLQESSDGGRQWRTVGKTAHTQGTANLAALSEGVFEFRITIADNGTELATSAPATLTVTGPGGATPAPVPQAPAAPTTPSPAPSGSGIPWLDTIAKPIWDSIIATIIAWIFSLL
jgi:hypothetical protein